MKEWTMEETVIANFHKRVNGDYLLAVGISDLGLREGVQDVVNQYLKDGICKVYEKDHTRIIYILTEKGETVRNFLYEL